MAKARTIEIYQTAKGKTPFSAWIDGLRDYKGKNRILARIDRVSLGNFGDSKGVGEGVTELRLDVGPGYRVYLAEDGATLVLLLCGGDKSSQTADIAAAKRYWKDYQERKP